MEEMFTRSRIIEGIKLAQSWYEGHDFTTLEPEQIYEAIQKAQVIPTAEAS